MCFGGSPKIKAPEPLPPSPGPPIPSEITKEHAGEARRRRIAALRYGLQSTIKTSPFGNAFSTNLLMPALAGAGTLRKTLGGA